MNIRQCDAYAGIGSRSTPKDILDQMVELAICFSRCGLTLRSGGASGADSAFEDGCDRAKGKKEIFLPFEYFNQNKSVLCKPPQAAFDMAAEYHPTKSAFSKMKYTFQAFHARNMQQVFGENLDCPVRFVVCWTPDGCESDETRTKDTGGTGQAISAASRNKIPVFNLANAGRYEEVKQYCEDCSMQYVD